jgi:8-amino-7-oxononanoate synthase
VDDVGRYLFKRGIYATLAAYPLVPKNEVGFRIQITAANNNQQIAHLVTVLEEVADRFKLQNASRVARWYRG